MTAECELRVDPQLKRRHAQLLEPGDRRLRERRVREVRQRRSPPERQRGPRVLKRAGGVARRQRPVGFLELALEASQVEPVALDQERIPGRPRDQGLPPGPSALRSCET